MARQYLLMLSQVYPELKDAFGRVDINNPMGGNFTAHSLRISAAWDMLMNMVDKPEILNAALEHLADQHAARFGLKRQHFATLGEMTLAWFRQVTDYFDFLSGQTCIMPLFEGIASKLPN
jgi:hemoglobin-like flavoprotein